MTPLEEEISAKINIELFKLIKKNEMGNHCLAITYLHTPPIPPILHIQNPFAKILQDNKINKLKKIRYCSKQQKKYRLI